MNETKHIQFYADPGHGWYETTIQELHTLGIAEKITAFSYRDGSTVYLEEDMDATTYFLALERAQTVVEIHDHHQNTDSGIRTMPPYTSYMKPSTWHKRYKAAHASYNYCGICGHTPHETGDANRAPLKWWDCDDGWKIGTLCRYCAEDELDTKPNPKDYAYQNQDEMPLANINTDEDPLEALYD